METHGVELMNNVNSNAKLREGRYAKQILLFAALKVNVLRLKDF